MNVVSRVEMQVPGDKSISHRAIMFAALADGASRVRGLLPGEDPQSTASVLRMLGAGVPTIPGDGGEVSILGRGLQGLTAPDGDLDCGNSGTTARLMFGILAGHKFSATLTGDDSLRTRPMRRVTEPLQHMGARFQELGAPDRLPIRVTGGTLRPIDFASPRASAQVKSAILLAGLTGGVEVCVREPGLSRDHTERMLRAMGVSIETEIARDGGAIVTLSPPERLEPLDWTVPGDFSSAAFFIAYALLAPGAELAVRGVGVNPTRAGMLPVLERMGARVELENPSDVGGEPVADVVVGSAALHGTEIGGAEMPTLLDEIPIIAAIAARAEGVTRITGAEELRVKESDRLAVVAENLRAVGVHAEELPDGMIIHGTDAPLRGAVRVHHDHRIAMAFGVLAALPGNEITLDQPEAVSVSYPGFWQDLARCKAAWVRV